ncbi:MAG TPA: amidohydrolase family protein [Vicinamibacteria bacterium]|nr:amidohydrolase family protein [Vicinamibacteria bacterium]
MLNRREFLKSASSGLIFCRCSMASGARETQSRTSTRIPLIAGRKPLTVDVHGHCFIRDDWPLIRDRPEARELERIMAAPYFPELIGVENRITEMDRMGIDVQALSLYVGQYHYWAEPALAEKLVRIQNEKLAELCATYPNRLVGLGAVSLHLPDLAARQMAHAVDAYDFRGFMITGSVGDEQISAPRFEPFWKQAEELETLIFVHPRGFGAGDIRFEGHGWLSNTIGNPLETTLALSHLIFSGFLDRFPRLRICAAHGGGYLPSYVGRSDNCYAVDPRCQHMSRKPSEYLSQMYFDTLVYSNQNLRYLIDQVGVDRIVMGTDYPFPVASRDPLDDVLSVPGLDDAAKEAIFGATAARLLKLRS